MSSRTGSRRSRSASTSSTRACVDRFQLFRALQMQDRLPGVRLGEAAAALGYAPIGAVERLYQRFTQLSRFVRRRRAQPIARITASV